MKATTNHYAGAVITIRQHTMAAVAATQGVGRSKSLGLGELDRLGEFCMRTREISQGGIGG